MMAVFMGSTKVWKVMGQSSIESKKKEGVVSI